MAVPLPLLIGEPTRTGGLTSEHGGESNNKRMIKDVHATKILIRPAKHKTPKSTRSVNSKLMNY